MGSRQHNAQFHKSKTLDNKYVRILAPPDSDPGGIRVLLLRILGLSYSHSLCLGPRVCRCLEMR